MSTAFALHRAMKKILIIGIGAGDPDFVTMQAAKALNTVDVFFILEKGAAKDGMMELRREICRRHAGDRAYRVVEAPSPPREPRPADYAACVDDLNRAKQDALAKMIADGLGEGHTGAILAWGDPSLYDSTIRNVEAIAAREGLEYEVIPGITAVQVLAARHRITLNTIGQPVQITTGRRLAEGWPDGVDSVVVMLDGEDTYRRFADRDVDIYWGAYLGTPDEILLAGRLSDMADEIHRVRSAARKRHGWIMDTYLLRRR
jgi:precorrin-6A synthase